MDSSCLWPAMYIIHLDYLINSNSSVQGFPARPSHSGFALKIPAIKAPPFLPCSVHLSLPLSEPIYSVSKTFNYKLACSLTLLCKEYAHLQQD